MKTKILYATVLVALALIAQDAPAAALEPPMINSPGDTNSPGPVFTNLTPIFSWSPVAGATGYGIYIREIMTNTLIFNNNGGIKTGTSYLLPSNILTAGHSFRWAMTTFSSSGEGSQSSYRYFETVTALVTFSSIPATGTPVDNFSTLFPGITLSSNNLWIADTVNNAVFKNISGRAITTSTNQQAPITIKFAIPAQDVAMDFGSGQLGHPVTSQVIGYKNSQIVFTSSFTTVAVAGGGQEVHAQTSGAVDQLVIARIGGDASLLLDNLSYNNAPIPPPQINSIAPNPVPASASQQIVTINGSNFVSKPTVTLTWTGQSNYTVPSAQVAYVSAAQVQMAITVSTTPDNWTVKITNPDGQSSNTVGFQVVNNLPLSPTNMEAQAFSDHVLLGWEDNSTNETGFKIERLTGTGAYAQIATTGANATNSAFYTDNTTSPHTTYTYRVRAYNGYGDSGYTNEVTATTPGGPPGAFTLSNDAPVWDSSIPGPKVQLNWTPSSDAGNYAVYRNGSVYQAGIAGTGYLNSANLTAGATYTYFIRASNADGTTDSNTVTVTMPIPVPAAEIAVESPLNTNIADGGSKSFGSVVVGATTSLTFTIKNVGTADLTGLTLTKNGTDAGMFAITSYPTTPVGGPSGSTTFVVKFAPTSAGAKTAALHIASNDSDENPFDMTLTGSGAALPSSLAVQGSANVSAGSTTSYTCVATFADTTTADVSNQVTWIVSGGPSGTRMSGSTLAAGSGAASMAYLTASLATSAGVISKTVAVAIGTGLAVNITAVTATYQSGTGSSLTYQLQATATVKGGSGSITTAWKINNTTLTGASTSLDAGITATPGSYDVTVTVTDGGGATAAATMSVLLPKAAQANEKFPKVSVTVGHSGTLYAKDAATPLFIDPERKNNGLIVIIHGMDNQVTTDYADAWMKKMADAIQEKLGIQAPNIALYDWHEDADTANLPISAIKTASSEFAQTVWPPEAPFGKKILAATSVLGAGEGAGLIDIAGTSAIPINLLALRPKAGLHGNGLADYIHLQILAGKVNPGAPIHLIGHSAGGFVASNCGKALLDDETLRSQLLMPTKLQVTTLDTPFLRFSQILDIRDRSGKFERYVSSYLGEMVPGVVILKSYDLVESFLSSVQQGFQKVASFVTGNKPAPGFEEAVTYHSGADIDVEGFWHAIDQHVDAHEWYTRTIQNPDKYGEGFYYSPFPGSHAFPGAGSMAATGFAKFAESIFTPPASISGFSTFGNVSEATAGTYILTEQGNAGIYQEVTLPMNVSTVKFRVQFTQAGDGDFIEVSFGDHLSLAVVADGIIVRGGPTEFEVPVVAFGGETGQFLIKLNGVGTDNAIAVLDNISITTDDDADGDLLTFAQETTIGTDPRYYDTDADGIDDWSEVNTTLTNPLLADSDGDGMSDSAEIFAGTNGMNANSVFRATGTTVAADGTVTVTWAAKAGKTYHVQRSDSPGFANYTVVGDNIPGVEPTTSFTDSTVPVGTQRMFYRVEVE
jgi:hypothetical protein